MKFYITIFIFLFSGLAFAQFPLYAPEDGYLFSLKDTFNARVKKEEFCYEFCIKDGNYSVRGKGYCVPSYYILLFTPYSNREIEYRFYASKVTVEFQDYTSDDYNGETDPAIVKKGDLIGYADRQNMLNGILNIKNVKFNSCEILKSYLD